VVIVGLPGLGHRMPPRVAVDRVAPHLPERASWLMC
jgi:hypothetical protein